MSIEKVASNDDFVLWQIMDDEDSPLPEPAILIREYSDTICLVQDDKEILLNNNRKNLNQLIKALKEKASK
jgi:hypothetical protein